MKKVLLLAPFSAPSKCGIWKRASDDAKALIDEGYTVTAFTSNILKGTDQKLPKIDEIENIKIRRFKVWFKLGGTSMFWFPLFSILKLKPDIIHVHGYRHPHSIQGLIAGKLMGKKVLITSHGPFKKDPRRSILLKLIDMLYDLFIGWWELRLYSKIIRVSNWERKYFKRFGISEKKQITIPNGIDEKFLETENKDSGTPKNRVINIGRVDPVKRLEWMRFAARMLPQLSFKILGPLQGYKEFNTPEANLDYENRSYSKDEAINELDNADIFLLPSQRESFGIVALEAMARSLIVISSNTLGINEFVSNGENGFTVESESDMATKIKEVYDNWDSMLAIRENARRTAENYDRRTLGKILVRLYSEI